MHANGNRGLARRITDRLDCTRSGHEWATAEVTLGEISLVRGECARCGAIGRVHEAFRHVETTSRATV
jgi:hypothetical protein